MFQASHAPPFREKAVLAKLEHRMRLAALASKINKESSSVSLHVFTVGTALILTIGALGIVMLPFGITVALAVMTLLWMTGGYGYCVLFWCAFIKLQCHDNFDLGSDFRPKAAKPEWIRVVHFVNGWPVKQMDWHDAAEGLVAKSNLDPTAVQPHEVFIAFDNAGRRVFHFIGSEDRLFPHFWGKAYPVLSGILGSKTQYKGDTSGQR